MKQNCQNSHASTEGTPNFPGTAIAPAPNDTPAATADPPRASTRPPRPLGNATESGCC